MSWEPYVTAIMRGVTQALPLEEEHQEHLRQALEAARPRTTARATAVFRERLGLERPARGGEGYGLAERAQEAFGRLSAGRQRDLRNLAKLIALEEDEEQARLAEELVERAFDALLGLPAFERDVLVAAAGPDASPRVASPAGLRALRKLAPSRRTVIAGALTLFLVGLGVGVSAPWWGPSFDRALRRLLRDEHEFAALEKASRRLETLDRGLVSVLRSLKREEPPRLAEARALTQTGRTSLGEDELASARESLDEAARVYGLALDDLVGVEAESAQVQREEWERMARAFRWSPPRDLSHAMLRLEKARAGATGAESDRREAALAFREAGTLFRQACRSADREPPRVTILRPTDGHATHEARLTLEGTVRDAHFLDLTLNGEQLATRPGADPWERRFRAELRLKRLGKRTFQLKAVDRNGRHVTLERTFERLPLGLTVSWTAPEADAVHGKGPLPVRGLVKGPARAAEITVFVNGQPAKVDAQGRFQVSLAKLEEGLQMLEAVARAPFARGVASRRIRIDRTPPRLTVSKVPSSHTWEDKLLLRVEAVDSSPWVQVRIGKLERRISAGKTTTFELPLAEGLNTFRVVATDAAGNTSSPVKRSTTRRPDPKLLKPFRTGVKRYTITRTIVVPAGERLEVSEGSRLEFKRGAALVCRGALSLRGRRLAPVTLSGQGWQGISIQGARARADLRWTVVEGGAKASGGGLQVVKGARLKMTDSQVRGCRATKFGGGLDVYDATVTCLRVTIAKNDGGKEGGGVYLSGRANASFVNCTISDNKAENYGGGVAILGSAKASATATFTSTRLERNRAAFGGGLQIGRAATASITGGQFSLNKGGKRGGGIYLTGYPGPGQQASVTCRGTRFLDNASAEGAGVGINVYGQGRFERCSFLRNHASGNGGGLIVVGAADQTSGLACVGVVFRGNSASGDGGALNVNHYAIARLDRCQLLDNVARQWGGGLCAIGKADPPTRLDVIKTRFRGNQAPDARGADVRIGVHTLFDTKQLPASGLTDPKRYSLAPGLVDPAAPKTAPPPPEDGPPPAEKHPPRRDGIALIKSDTAFARKLAEYVRRGLKNDFSDIRGKERPRITVNRCWPSKIGFPGARTARVWLTPKKVQYASVGFGPYPSPVNTAQKVYARILAQVSSSVRPGWQKKETRKPNGSRDCLWLVRLNGHTFRLRLDLYVFFDRRTGQNRASVTFYIN